MRFKSASPTETRHIAGMLLKKILKKTGKNKALTIALQGDLGSGKTSFAKGFLRAAGVRRVATSPTFTIVKHYPLRGGKALFHMDVYRIKSTVELKHLRFDEAVRNPKNVLLIEWPERLGRKLPRGATLVTFAYGKKENERIIEIK